MGQHRLQDQTEELLIRPISPTDPPRGRHRKPSSIKVPSVSPIVAATVATATIGGSLSFLPVAAYLGSPDEPTTASQPRISEEPAIGRFAVRAPANAATPATTAAATGGATVRPPVAQKPKPPPPKPTTSKPKPPPKQPAWVNPVPGAELVGGFRTADRPSHEGIDLAIGIGTPIRAASAGTVEHSGTWGGCGLTIILNHGNGLTTTYCHAGSLNVAVGDRVTAGQMIARVGMTGDTSGPHLHFEVRINEGAINPLPFMSARGVDF